MICGYCNKEFNEGSHIKKLNSRVICSWSCEKSPTPPKKIEIGTLPKNRDFNAGWCDTLKCYVTSWKDQETKAKNHRSRSHPNGFSMIQDDKKFLNELKQQRKYKEDILKSIRPGYKFGEAKKKYDENRPDIHRSGRRIFSYSK